MKSVQICRRTVKCHEHLAFWMERIHPKHQFLIFFYNIVEGQKILPCTGKPFIGWVGQRSSQENWWQKVRFCVEWFSKSKSCIHRSRLVEYWYVLSFTRKETQLLLAYFWNTHSLSKAYCNFPKLPGPNCKNCLYLSSLSYRLINMVLWMTFSYPMIWRILYC